MFLMPSQFEPCGIGQLIAMRYGSLPIVRETGGLKDTVNSYNEFSGEGNGFSFTNYNAHDMLYTIKRALNFYYNKGVWNNLMINSMKIDNSWNKSANEYIQIYDKLLWDM
ncbi:glycogen synthase [Clostridium tetanomorphum]|nr:glycogen synthase [Clostridium tetanomorphum]